MEKSDKSDQSDDKSSDKKLDKDADPSDESEFEIDVKSFREKVQKGVEVPARIQFDIATKSEEHSRRSRREMRQSNYERVYLSHIPENRERHKFRPKKEPELSESTQRRVYMQEKQQRSLRFSYLQKRRRELSQKLRGMRDRKESSDPEFERLRKEFEAVAREIEEMKSRSRSSQASQASRAPQAVRVVQDLSFLPD